MSFGGKKKKTKLTFKRSLNAQYRPKGSSVKLAILAIALLLVCLFLAKIYILVQYINKPLGNNFTTHTHDSWDANSSVNIILKNSTISVLNYDPKEKKAVLLKIPNQTYIDVSKGFGSWKIESIYDLGQAETPPIGAKLLEDSVTNLLGLPIDGLIVFKDSAKNEQIDELVKKLTESPLKALPFINKIDSDLTPIELLNLYTSLSKLRPDKFVFLDMGQTNITYSKLLHDSSRVLGVDTVSLDKFVREKLGDSQVLQESISVAIFNSTSHPGLAYQASRLVTNIGGDVIIVGNSENSLEKSLVIFKNINTTTSKLSKIFAPECLRGSCNSNDPKIQSSRALISIILGEDFYKNWFLRE